MPTPVPPLDLTGVAASNLIQNEIHAVSEVNAATYRIIIPVLAPFYLHNLALEHVDQGGTVTPLNEGVDYYLVLPYMAATRSTGQQIYGGISIINEYANGTIRLVSYQTLGGLWCADAAYVYGKLLLSQFNKRTTWWDSITNVQQLFPATDHATPMDQVVGHLEMIAKMEEIRAAILSTPNVTPGLFAAHLLQTTGNPHGVTKEEVGLGNVQDYPQATDAEVLAHAHVDKTVTLRQILLLLGL